MTEFGGRAGEPAENGESRAGVPGDFFRRLAAFSREAPKIDKMLKEKTQDFLHEYET